MVIFHSYVSLPEGIRWKTSFPMGPAIPPGKYFDRGRNPGGGNYVHENDISIGYTLW